MTTRNKARNWSWVLLFTPALFLASSLAGCDRQDASSRQSMAKSATVTSSAPESSYAAGTVEFFSDLPGAEDVPIAEMGDLYFKLLTRVTAKVRAVRGTAAAEATMDIIRYARREAQILEDRSEALAEEERKDLFGDAVTTMTYAQSQYKRAVRSIQNRESGKLDDFVEFAAEPWPSIQR